MEECIDCGTWLDADGGDCEFITKETAHSPKEIDHAICMECMHTRQEEMEA